MGHYYSYLLAVAPSGSQNIPNPSHQKVFTDRVLSLLTHPCLQILATLLPTPSYCGCHRRVFPDVGPDVVDEQVAPSLANVDELAPRLRYAVVPSQTCKLEKNVSCCTISLNLKYHT